MPLHVCTRPCLRVPYFAMESYFSGRLRITGCAHGLPIVWGLAGRLQKAKVTSKKRVTGFDARANAGELCTAPFNGQSVWDLPLGFLQRLYRKSHTKDMDKIPSVPKYARSKEPSRTLWSDLLRQIPPPATLSEPTEYCPPGASGS